MQGNTGQLSYTYPLQVPPGTGGFAPHLVLTYSSSNTNERHSPNPPAGDEGEGWSLSLGSITSEVYPTSPTPTTWYFLNGVDNSGDRLILYDSTNLLYYTEHLSYLRVQQVTSSVTNQPCFKVWDTSGTYYELGCTLDSLQYSTDSGGTRHNYQWDVNKIVAPNEGSSSPSYRLILVSYEQDRITNSGHTTMRDAVMKQIVYGYASSTNVTSLASTATAGTVDFSYYAPFNDPPWAQAYYQYPSNYTCSNTPPASTSLRCDDPIDYPGPPTVTAPTVMSTFSPISVTSYVGTDSSIYTTAYSYDFTFQDRSFYQDGSPWPCKDPTTLNKEYCAGEHLLTGNSPSVWQNGTKHLLKGLSLTYSPYTGTGSLQNTYYDSLHQVGSPAQPYQNTTYWQYLTDYQDTNTGVGEHIAYSQAYNNTDGTPNQYDQYGNILDDRFDALYCSSHRSDCMGNYAHPDDHAWSEYVVAQIKSWGQDSSALLPAIITFNYYRLAQTGTYNGGAWCYPDPQSRENACVGDNWLPQGDSDWQDYYHGEFRGFTQVWITSPASDLTIDYYFSTKGWYTAANDPLNYNAGQLQQEEIYKGTNNISTTLLSRTTYTYANSANACYTPAGSSLYAACDVMVLISRTTQYEGSTSSNPPWVEHDYTYDDYTSGGGLQAGYHNLTQDAVSTSTGTSYTRKWTYTPNNSTVGNWTYYDVNKVTHSEVDAASTVWQCQDATYDEGSGAATTPAAGWPTTLTGHSDCSNLSGSAITSYVGYDQFGNTVASVDGVATANSSLYSSNGCTLATAPRVKSSNWSQAHYTSCAVYDTNYNAQPVTVTNAFGQAGSISYDYTQGALPTSGTDPNSQQTTYTYSFNGSNPIVQVKLPSSSGSYTSQSSTNSTCTGSSVTPCFESDTNSYLYSSAVARTFFDSLGRLSKHAQRGRPCKAPSTTRLSTPSTMMPSTAPYKASRFWSLMVVAGWTPTEPSTTQAPPREGLRPISMRWVAPLASRIPTLAQAWNQASPVRPCPRRLSRPTPPPASAMEWASKYLCHCHGH